MTYRRTDLAMTALTRAAELRRLAQIPPTHPLNIYDFTEQCGVEVRFVDIPSLEGMYFRRDRRPVIFLSSHRPAGRQASTCGHELGHHEFKHGTRVDRYLEGARQPERFDPDEFLVECFSGLLLMPKSAVNHAFTIRGWDLRSCTPVQAYTIAGLFGVGYATLLQHMSSTLRLISSAQATQLRRTQPKDIRSSLLGTASSEHVIVVDAHWPAHPIDLQVDDLIIAPPGVICEGRCVKVVEQNATRTILRGLEPGRGRVLLPSTGWATFTRVSRRHYVGRSLFRHLEDSDAE